jgi:pyruvate,orthophosphate dikinase
MFKPLQRLTDWIFHPNYKKQVYKFNEGSINDRIILGNKGANLCEMSRMNLPIPPGFIITTEACNNYLNEKKIQNETKKEEINEELKTTEGDSHISNEFPQSLMNEYQHNIHLLENETNRTFGLDQETLSSNTAMPLLISVRSGSAVSMPGMMDTILNLGINDSIVVEVIKITKNTRFAYDLQRRFLQMYGNVVLNVDKAVYENILKKYKDKKSITSDYDLKVDDLKEIIKEFKGVIAVPDDPWEQLHMAIEGIFKSWNTKRAVAYRNIHHISHDLGTAVTVQSMVYGNMNHNSGSGVCFTRNPTNGENNSYGEYLPMSEGEEVVAGTRNPMQLGQLLHELPSIYSDLITIEKKLEVHYQDVQDIEFTVENGQLFILQTRNAKRTAIASVKIAVSMVKEKLITEREALKRIDASQMDYFLHPMIDPEISSTGNDYHITL